ncbi:MAG: methyltransferase C-terminal domain-containing protein, partial [Synechocystis sp.]
IMGFVTHQGKRSPSERLQQMRQAEVEEKSNEYQTYLDFAQRIEQMKAENLAYLATAKQAGKTIWGFGAPVKGNTLLNYFGIGTQYLDYLVEKNELRRGLISPGMHIPLLIEKELTSLPDIY